MGGASHIDLKNLRGWIFVSLFLGGGDRKCYKKKSLHTHPLTWGSNPHGVGSTPRERVGVKEVFFLFSFCIQK